MADQQPILLAEDLRAWVKPKTTVRPLGLIHNGQVAVLLTLTTFPLDNLTEEAFETWQVLLPPESAMSLASSLMSIAAEATIENHKESS